jgi:hypothetical protein
VGSGFTLPVPNVDIYGNLKWTKSYTLFRGMTPSDTSIIWPEFTGTLSFGDFASKLPILRNSLRSMTANSSFNYRKEEKRALFSQSSDSRLTGFKMTPLLRLSATTNKDVHLEHSFNLSLEDEMRYTKNPGDLRLFRWYGGDTSLVTFPRDSATLNPVKRTNLGNDFTISYDVETQKGLQFWRYYIKLKNNLRLKLTESAAYIIVEEKPLGTGDWEKSAHELQFTTKPEASYNFTNNIDARFHVEYKYRRDMHTETQTSTHEVTVHSEFTMRF